MSELKTMKTWFKLPVVCMPSDIGGWMEHVNFGVKGLSSHHCEAIEDAINNHDRLVEENRRLTAIATKHATRSDELYEALEKIMPAVKQYLEYEHDGDPWTEDARSMGEMDLNELDKEGVIEEIYSILDKSRIEAEKGNGICN